jgi:type II secretory pathway component HofQ
VFAGQLLKDYVMKKFEIKTMVFGKAACLVALSAIGIGSLLATPVHAQDTTLPTREVNITLNQAPVRTALDTLFKSAGLNYTIDPAVTGLVTVSLRAIPFDVALRSILRSADPPLAFTVEDGVYNIHPRQQQIAIETPTLTGTGPATPVAALPQADTSTQVVQLKLNYANAQLILRYALSGPNTGYIPSLDAPPTSGRGGTGTGGTSITSGGIGGSSGGFGGQSSGGGGFSSGGQSSGGGGFSTGGF